MKKFLLFFTVFTMLLCIPVCSNAQNAKDGADITVYLNDAPLSFDVSPIIIDGRTMVPVRTIFEALGSIVTWDVQTKSVNAEKDGTTVNLVVNSKTMFVNGKPKYLDVAPVIVDARTLVPLRAVAESFDCEVEWKQMNRSVFIRTDSDFTYQKPVLTAAEIYEKLIPSVFYIENSSTADTIKGTGSGFFITADGLAVTNFHVISGFDSATVTTIRGDSFPVERIIDVNEEQDLAFIRISKTSTEGKTVPAFPVVPIGNSDHIKAGQTVYTLGNPEGNKYTISSGIIGNANQLFQEGGVDGYFIQITAPVSHGSSGGALVNEFGEVIGVNAAADLKAQNVNFSIPINKIKMLDAASEGMSYPEFSELYINITMDSLEKEVFVGDTCKVPVTFSAKNFNGEVYIWNSDESVASCKLSEVVVTEEREEDYPVGKQYMLEITGKAEGTTDIKVYTDNGRCSDVLTVYVYDHDSVHIIL
ncbi:MAG: trypsin-like peptidase domain-containing protein [Clostridia bacterium]|nr:trypsin-like peptidase domain-containing protein [Clostridia bacterium]